MAQQTINIGTTPNDGLGDTARDAAVKINENFTELYERNHFVSKPSDTSRSAATVIQDDPHLVLSGLAAGTYMIQSYIWTRCSASSGGGIRIIWQLTNGSFTSGSLVSAYSATGSAFATAAIEGAVGTGGSSLLTSTRPNNTSLIIINFSGLVTINTSTAATLRFGWAQNTSNAVATIVATNSNLAAVRVV